MALATLVSLAALAWLVLDRSDAPVPPADRPRAGAAEPSPTRLPPVSRTRLPLDRSALPARPQAHPVGVSPADLVVRGVVLEARGFGLPGCRVELSATTTALGAAAIDPLTGRTDRTGRFELRAPAGTWRWMRVVRVRVEDRSGTPVFVGPAVLQPEMILQVAALRRLHGRLLRRDGEPIAKAFLQLEAPAEGRPGGRRYSMRLRTLDDGSFSTRRRIDECYLPEAFVVRFLPSGGGLVVQRVATADLLSPQGATIVADAVVVEVVVVDRRGRPVEGARVRAASSGWGPRRARHDFCEARTDARGRARLWISPGDLELAAGAPGYGPTARRVEGVARDAEVRLSLPDGDVARLTGRVLDPDARALAGARVLAAFFAAGHPELGGVCERSATTGEDGAFELELPRAAFPCLVGVFHASMYPLDIRVDSPDQPVVVRYPTRTGSLVLRVQASTAGAPALAGPLTVHAVHRSTGESRAVEWLDANQVLRWLAPGRWNLAVSLPGWHAVGTTECEVVAGRTRVVDVDLVPSLALTGTVVDPRGRPVAGVVVRLEDAAFGTRPPPWTSFRTGPSGRFRLWTPAWSHPDTVVVTDGEAVRARVRLHPGRDHRIVLTR